MILCWLALLANAGGEPGDVDRSFSEVTTDDGYGVIRTREGALWFAGEEEMVHLSADGRLRKRYAYEDIRYLVSHPKGGVFFRAAIDQDGADEQVTVWIQADGNVATAVVPPMKRNRAGQLERYFQAAGRLWEFRERRLVLLGDTGETLRGFDYPWGQVDHIASGPDKSIAVLGLHRGGKAMLVRFSVADGTMLTEVEVELGLGGFGEVVFLEDGRFLEATYGGLRRRQADGKLDLDYESTVRVGSEGARFARRPDGRTMLAIEDGMVGQLRTDEDDDHFILVRLTKDGDLDDSFPGVVVPGRPQWMAATNAWTFYAGSQVRSDESVHRVDSGDALPLVHKPRTVREGVILEAIGRDWGKGSFCALPRGDGYDDLIAASWGPSKGLWHMINSKDPMQTWQQVLIEDEGKETPTRRLAVGKLDGDALPDVLEWRLPSEAEGGISVHWYRGVQTDSGRALRYAGKLTVGNLPEKPVVVDVRLADVDSDGDHDMVVRSATHFGVMIPHDPGAPLDPPTLHWWRNDGVEQPWQGMAINQPGDFAGAPLIVIDDDGMPASNLYVKDLDSDGDPDIASVVLSAKVASRWFENIEGRFEARATPIQVIPEMERAVMPKFDPWLGGIMTRADVNGDGKPDRILVFPGYEPEDFDDDRRWARGLRWERGGGPPR